MQFCIILKSYFCNISSYVDQIYKKIVSIPLKWQVLLIMWGRQKKFKDPVCRSWDMANVCYLCIISRISPRLNAAKFLFFIVLTTLHQRKYWKGTPNLNHQYQSLTPDFNTSTHVPLPEWSDSDSEWDTEVGQWLIE